MGLRACLGEGCGVCSCLACTLQQRSCGTLLLKATVFDVRGLLAGRSAQFRLGVLSYICMGLTLIICEAAPTWCLLYAQSGL